MHAIGFGPGLALRSGLFRKPVFDFSDGMPAGATFTRASVGTRFDASGALVSEASDVARFDHDPVGLVRRGLLIEPAATNLVLASHDLTQSAWIKLASSATASVLTEDTQTTSHRVSPAALNRSVTAGEPITISAIAGERSGSAKRWFALTLTAAGFAAVPAATFDLASGSVTSLANGSAGMVPAGGGQWLCWLSATPTITTASQGERYILTASSGAAASYAGDGASGLSIGELQFESGSVATSRIRTTTAAVSRAADVLVLDWASRGVADGAVTLRYSFDDASTEDRTTTIAGGTSSVPTDLARPWITRIERL